MTQHETIRWRNLPMRVKATRRGAQLYSLDGQAWAGTPLGAFRAITSKERTVFTERGAALLRRRRPAIKGPPYGTVEWTLCMLDAECFETEPEHFKRRPSLDYIRQYADLAWARSLDPAGNPELGWRAWVARRTDGEWLLASPHQNTIWHDPELRAPSWSESEAVRGNAGIHARRMPRNWRRAGWYSNGHTEGPDGNTANLVHGVVERFGRFVLGSTGWRAEWTIIRELEAPNLELAQHLRESYPEVPIYVRDEYIQKED